MWKDKRVLVTGSSRGIGKGIAKKFADHGAAVFLTARGCEELEATRRELERHAARVKYLAADLLQPHVAMELVGEAASRFGSLDILVTNAGAAEQAGFLELSDEAWAIGFGLKMFANLRVIKAAWPFLKASQGHLVMIGGGTGKTPDRRLSLVSAVNGGQAALSKSIAEQGILDGIHVNLVQPGIVKTSRRRKLFEKWAAQAGTDVETYMAQMPKDYRITRLGEPSDIAEVVAFLCSDASRWIHGAIIDVDGGQTKGL
ncbi:MAG: SDR family oxidoreductase [Gammaproteobacteria bacterium]